MAICVDEKFRNSDFPFHYCGKARVVFVSGWKREQLHCPY